MRVTWRYIHELEDHFWLIWIKLALFDSRDGV